MLEWILGWIDANEALFWSLFAVSVVTFLATLLLAPMLVARLPHDYFAHERRHTMPWGHRHIVVRVTLIAAKNLLGGVLLAMGVIMLVTPGQGLITLIAGLMLLDYPGKYQLERWIVSRASVLRTINWLRARAGRRPLKIDGDSP